MLWILWTWEFNLNRFFTVWAKHNMQKDSRKISLYSWKGGETYIKKLAVNPNVWVGNWEKWLSGHSQVRYYYIITTDMIVLMEIFSFKSTKGLSGQNITYFLEPPQLPCLL